MFHQICLRLPCKSCRTACFCGSPRTMQLTHPDAQSNDLDRTESRQHHAASQHTGSDRRRRQRLPQRPNKHSKEGAQNPREVPKAKSSLSMRSTASAFLKAICYLLWEPVAAKGFDTATHQPMHKKNFFRSLGCPASGLVQAGAIQLSITSCSARPPMHVEAGTKPTPGKSPARA